MAKFNQILLDRLDERRAVIQKVKPQLHIRGGWLSYIRKSLNMKQKTLAQRMGLSTSSICEIEARELKGQVTLKKMKAIAESMECEFIYAIIPKRKPMDLIKRKALKKAKLLLETTDLHMKLENQSVKGSKVRRIKILCDELIRRGDVW